MVILFVKLTLTGFIQGLVYPPPKNAIDIEW